MSQILHSTEQNQVKIHLLQFCTFCLPLSFSLSFAYSCKRVVYKYCLQALEIGKATRVEARGCFDRSVANDLRPFVGFSIVARFSDRSEGSKDLRILALTDQLKAQHVSPFLADQLWVIQRRRRSNKQNRIDLSDRSFREIKARFILSKSPEPICVGMLDLRGMSARSR